jgi:hypothetical protein
MIFGPAAAVIMAVLIMIATFGCNNGLILSGARVYYAMAKDGLFFKSTGTLNRKSVPGTALVVQGIWASLLCLSGKYNELLDYVIFAVLVFFVLIVSGIFILRKKHPDWERPYKAWGYPVPLFISSPRSPSPSSSRRSSRQRSFLSCSASWSLHPEPRLDRGGLTGGERPISSDRRRERRRSCTPSG